METDNRPMTRLEELAAQVAICAPLKQGKYSVCANIPWTIVDEIRAELERSEQNWRAWHKRAKEIEEARLQRRIEKAAT